jgi:hypothetical protein
VSVLVVGGGIAGAAAVHAAEGRGHEVVWCRGGIGASALGSGAADLAPWDEAPDHEPLSPELVAFVEALRAFRRSERSSRVLSAVGALRRARLCDPLVLDLAPLAGAHLGVVESDPGPHLALAVSESAWARESGLRVTPWRAPTCPRHARQAASDTVPFEGAALVEAEVEFARLGDELARVSPRPTAWLLPENWLPSESLQRLLEARLQVPVGTTLGSFGGVMGARLQLRIERVGANGVKRIDGFLERVRPEPEGALVTIAAREQRFGHVVLCLGGAGGGGVRLDVERRLLPSVEIQDLDVALSGHPSFARARTVSSAGSIDLASLGVGVAARLGFTEHRGSTRVVLAGEFDGRCQRTLLGAAQSAIDAVARLA